MAEDTSSRFTDDPGFHRLPDPSDIDSKDRAKREAARRQKAWDDWAKTGDTSELEKIGFAPGD